MVTVLSCAGVVAPSGGSAQVLLEAGGAGGAGGAEVVELWSSTGLGSGTWTLVLRTDATSSSVLSAPLLPSVTSFLGASGEKRRRQSEANVLILHVLILQ